MSNGIGHGPKGRLVTAGYYDLATPYFDAVYTIGHLGLPES